MALYSSVVRRLIRLGAAVTLGLGATAAGAQALVLHYQERPPYSQTASADTVTGLVADPAAQALRRAGITFVWAQTPSQRQFALIESGRGFDCGLGWFRTAEREARGKFTRALYRDQPFAVLARSDSGLGEAPSVRDLLTHPNATLLVKEGYSYGPALDALIAQRAPTARRTAAEMVQLVRMIAAGRADWTIVTSEEVAPLLRAAGAPAHALRLLRPVDMPAGQSRHLFCSRAVPDAWIERIDRALAAMER